MGVKLHPSLQGKKIDREFGKKVPKQVSHFNYGEIGWEMETFP
jgi:hypothetical protein